MKVAVVHNLASGGAHRRVSEQLQRLSVEAQEFTLSTAKPVTENALVVKASRLADGVRKQLRPLLRYVDFLLLLLSYWKLRRAIARYQPDVIWLNPCRYLQAPFIKTRIPTVYYCDEPRRADYDSGAEKLRNPATERLYQPLRALERWADRSVVAEATAVATNSRFTAKRILDAYQREATVILAGVEMPDPPGPTLDHEHFLSVGTLIPTKGHDLAIGTVAASKLDLPLVIVGHRGNQAEHDRLQALADSASVNLRIVSDVSDRELDELYRKAMATLYLAVAEPFGLVSIEAQARGCPVVVANDGGLPETIVEGETGYAVARNVDDAAAALRLLTDPVTRSTMSERGRTHAATFSWATSATGMCGLFEKVAR